MQVRKNNYNSHTRLPMERENILVAAMISRRRMTERLDWLMTVLPQRFGIWWVDDTAEGVKQ